MLRNFHDLSFAPKVITSLESVGAAAGDQFGAKRVLNGAFHETLQGLNDVDRVVKYSIDDGPEAVSRDRVREFCDPIYKALLDSLKHHFEG